MNPPPSAYGIQSTAGAIPVRNEKGELSMQKVKVHRYFLGKRPDYAPADSGSDSSDDDFIEKRNRRTAEDDEAARPPTPIDDDDDDNIDDPRLRRLKLIERDAEKELPEERRRRIHEPEVLDASASEGEDEEKPAETARVAESSAESDEDDSDLNEEEIERRRQVIRQKLMVKKKEEEVLMKEEEAQKSSEDDSDSSEYEEYTDSEEETGPRLKPVFVRKRDRVTIAEKEKEEQKRKQMEIEQKKAAEERKRQTLKMVEEIRKEEQQARKVKDTEPNLDDVCTEDENDEVEYEAWKLRELKRIKRDRDEREQLDRERMEVERLRNLTEEERRAEARLNPKVVTNKAAKGKYKFLQKYYHRGAFYLDKEEDVFKQDFSSATLDDHFDKTVLPKVMQVKNFGRSGRTKYTHLVDQDTTEFESPWTSETTQNLKFINQQAGGIKPIFEKPSLKKRRREQD